MKKNIFTIDKKNSSFVKKKVTRNFEKFVSIWKKILKKKICQKKNFERFYSNFKKWLNCNDFRNLIKNETSRMIIRKLIARINKKTRDNYFSNQKTVFLKCAINFNLTFKISFVLLMINLSRCRIIFTRRNNVNWFKFWLRQSNPLKV